jgi:tetratricopeptide (TPR) repeat protein
MNDMDKVKYLMSEMEKKIPTSVIPWTNRYLRLIRDSYALTTNQLSIDSLVSSNYSEKDLQILAENLYRLRLYDDAADIFGNIYQSNPNNVQALSMLIDIFDRTKQYNKGIEYLNIWLEQHPQDPQAKVKLSYFESKVKTP